MAGNTVKINRAPVLTLWGAVVAERMGYDWDESLTLGKAMAGLNAQTKGRSLGIFGPPKEVEKGAAKKRGLGEQFWVEVCGRPVPAKNTDSGVRAVIGDQAISPASAQRYIEGKFGADYEAARRVMEQVAASYDPDELADKAFGLYEKFRPKIAPGVAGWGQKGDLDLDLIASLAKRMADG